MRNLVLLFLALIVFSCNSSKSKSIIDENVKMDSISNSSSNFDYNSTAPKPYFDFDKVEYYYKNISEEELSKLYISKSESSEKFIQIYEEDLPENLKNGLTLSKDLIQFGWKKKLVNNSKFKVLNQIFSLKNCEENVSAECIPEYRDIFLFYKNDNLVGIAKICLSCRKSHIVGTNFDTWSFGQCGDFEKLEALVRNPDNLISQ